MPKPKTLAPDAALTDPRCAEIASVLRDNGVTTVQPEVLARVLADADRFSNPRRLAATYLFELYMGMLRPK